ncbi:MAG: hypothetical protein LBN04_06910 [Oscillospiraceae bacterium]|nr:hypothetical protein [Oscillospiraceae bacterium]
MSTSAIEKRRALPKSWRPAAAHLAVAALAFVVQAVYARFGHGVRSAAMTTMGLYPLLGGALPFALLAYCLKDLAARQGFRPFVNLWSAAVATLTASAFLRGVLEVAGTASPYPPYLLALGVALAVLALIPLARVLPPPPQA